MELGILNIQSLQKDAQDAETKRESGTAKKESAKATFLSIMDEIREDAENLAAGRVTKAKSPYAPSHAIPQLRENQAVKAEQTERQQEVEVIRRLMPDGTTRTTRYEGGKVAETSVSHPSMISTPDYSDPSWSKPDDGTTPVTGRTKLKAHLNLFDGL